MYIPQRHVLRNHQFNIDRKVFRDDAEKEISHQWWDEERSTIERIRFTRGAIWVGFDHPLLFGD